MKMRTGILLGMTGALLATTPAATAQGTVGRRLISLQVNRVELGGDAKEIKDYLDDIYNYGVTLQLPLGTYVELIANANRMNVTGKLSEDGMNVKLDAPITTFSGGVRIQFIPKGVFNPFIGAAYSLSQYDVEVKANGETMLKEDDSQKAIALSAGAEIALGDRAALMGFFSRTMPESKDRDFDIQGADDDRDAITIALNFWATDSVVIGALFAQELENDTRAFGLNLGFHF